MSTLVSMYLHSTRKVKRQYRKVNDDFIFKYLLQKKNIKVGTQKHVYIITTPGQKQPCNGWIISKKAKL